MRKLTLFIPIVVIILFACITKNQSDKKIIIVYTYCDDPEIFQDLALSIESNVDFFEKNEIVVESDTIEQKCGYILIFGEKKKQLESIMTDIELMMECKDFFKID